MVSEACPTNPREASGLDPEAVHKVLVNIGGFRHVRTTGDHLILRWGPPEHHEHTDTRVMTVPVHDSISIGTLHDIADDAGAENFEAFCEWIDEHRRRADSVGYSPPNGIASLTFSHP